MTSKKRKALTALNYDLFEAPPQTAPGELPTVDELYERFRRYNVQYFGGRLPTAKIRYSKRLLAAGLYIRDRGEIVISERYHQIFPEDIDDTLKHEMIHLIHFNHDADFRREAKRIGASRRAKSHPELRLPPRYIYECPICKTEYPRRKRLRMASCGQCSPSRFNPRYKLVLKNSLARTR
ncbi:MAG: SprT-like domain-containing protein [bacterium]